MALKRLNGEHLIAIQWLSQPKKGGKSFEEIAELCGVHRNTLLEWRKDPLFEKTLKAEMIRRSQDRLPELIESLADIAIRDGNAAMAKLALQINGMLTDKVEIETKGKSDDIDYAELDAELEASGSRFDDEDAQ